MSNLLILVFLVVAIAIGWMLGRLSKASRTDDDSSTSPALSRDYFAGLNFLLNEQPDRAIDNFVDTLEVSSDTIDTHITLGNLFRSRGESDRAARLHQNLLARPALSERQNDQVQLELARDFMHLGVLDRAEHLLKSLIKTTKHDDIRSASRRLLIKLFEQEKEWQQALELVPNALLKKHDDLRCAAAHWHCELAQSHFAKGRAREAQRHIKNALSIDAHCIRAYWLKAGHYHRQGRYKDEIQALTMIGEQNPTYTPLILDNAARAFRQLGDDAGLIRFLDHQIETTQNISAIVARAELGIREEGVHTVLQRIDACLDKHPSLRGIGFQASLYARQALTDVPAPLGDKAAKAFRRLQHHIQQLETHTSCFRCEHCGFSTSHLYWHCPQCKSWSTIKPCETLDTIEAQRQTPAQQALGADSTSS